ncbi:MAG: DUF4402 domain-containing protein [candidate division Zixibacteria bacterium]|nr:DUF4402 domain-containing protein [candidate division Zixibacteria bacterium]
MKKSLVALAIIVGVSIVAAGSANAAIIADITLTKTADMNFGDVIAGATLGTVVLTAAASPERSVTGGTELGNSTSVSSATFTVGGEGTSTYSITLPTSDVTITSGENEMTVNTFTSSPSGTGLLSGGTQTLYVGATLNVAADQASGSNYTGSFNVTVAYN